MQYLYLAMLLKGYTTSKTKSKEIDAVQDFDRL